ncbi:NAD(P)-dependent dehydrogenase, short-chain alcohol dehydrogenase family [Nonomuraea maritima]|uniref:NAD(P)-dependent dehydrogenase, short-chain alcohol dehydrogenase family n=1 Tax=Nonomuraea maritima TaxID=683260 RepID=A0A1G8TC80_9ACTN|nr:SDR family oxidoreductase [Nonomuraea maritima]SDJ39108.1 NAD(P)-dependent dehydrogenase, short-chain alcohol dehydrogenase family [Nonomuraea maritima]
MTLFSVAGKNVVVTGGSRGIGRMIAAGFVAAGASVHISARKSAEVEKTAAELGCVAVPADLSTPEGLETLVAAVDGPLHVLVNNAGATWGAPLEEYPEHAFDKLWDINVKGVFHLTQKFLPQLRDAASADDPARVINVGSVDGIKVPGLPTYAYSSTKSAVHMLTRHLARHLAKDHITVNAIAPGPFDSKMMAFALDDPETRTAIASNVPLGRIGRPDDMAGTAIFLASRAGSYLTGTVIPVDGGITA